MTLALQCADLRKQYGHHKVLHGIDLAVEAGSIHGLVGLNGAGKTTTLECILGLQPRDQGTVNIIGYSPEMLYQAEGKIGVVFDSPCLHPHLSVRQTLELARLQSRSTTLPSTEVEALLGISRYSEFKIRQLSLGNRRRTAIAQALINRPQFLILDEPFNGLDAGGVDDVLKLLQELNRQQGTSFLLASHQLAYLEKICTHVAILHEGRICLSEKLGNALSRDQPTVAITASDANQAKVVLGQIKGIEIVSNKGEDSAIHCRLLEITSAELNTRLVQLGVAVEQLTLRKPTLEALFYETVKGEEQ